jgi:hypothetical protein
MTAHKGAQKQGIETSVSLAEAQASLPRLIRRKQTIKIRSRDETVAFLVPRERMEALLETMEVLSNPKAMAAIQRDRSGKGTYFPLSALDEDES